MYSVKHSHGLTERFDTYEDACEGLRSVYGAAIHIEGDFDGGRGRQLCWQDEESSRDDDGARAVASIRECEVAS